MFELRNENEVWYQSDDMIMPIQYGLLYIATITQQTETQQKFEIQKFNFETEQYEHNEELETYDWFGKQVNVVNGYFTVNAIKPLEPEPSQLDRIETEIKKKNSEIAQDAVDKYTEELIEQGVI